MVTRTARLIAGIIATTLLVAGCGTATGRKTGQAMDDAGITAAVKTKLAGERLANLTQVNVDTKDAVVTLSGDVDTPDQRARAEQIARNTSAVRGVVNRITVDGAPAASPPAVR